MNMSTSFAPSIAEARPLAQHCSELTWRGPRPEERAENLAVWCRDLGHELSQELGQLFSGGKLKVIVAEPETVSGKEVFEQIGPVAANSLLRCGEDDQTILFSLDYATAIAMTDCSFGGEGTPPEDAPEQLPRSAALLIENVGSLLAKTISRSGGAAERMTGDVLVRSESVTRLKPFGEATAIALFSVLITSGEAAQWSAILAIAKDRLDGLLPGTSAGSGSKRHASSPSAEIADTFASMPLPLEAILSEFTIALNRLENLNPGDEIPIAIACELPLRAGDQIVAHGTLGTIENRMAMRVTRLPDAAMQETFAPVNRAQIEGATK